jgi:hypothetical protein
VEQEVFALAAAHGVPDAVRVTRNLVNIGGNANNLRCFELSEGEWMWLLGDDDAPEADALEKILNTLKKFPDVASIVFSSTRFKFAEDFLLDKDTGLHENEYPFMGGLTFMSGCVYNLAKTRKNLSTAYDFLYSSFPHTVLALSAVYGDGWKMLFSSEFIIKEGEDRGDPALHFSWQRVKLRFISLIEPAFLPEAAKSRLSRGILQHIYPNTEIVIEDCFYFLSGELLGKIKQGSGRFYMNEFANRFRGIKKIKISILLALRVSVMLLHFPWLGKIILKHSAKFRNRHYNDPTNRI